MAYAIDMSKISAEEEKQPVLDISPVVDLPNRIAHGFKRFFDITLTSAEFSQRGLAFEDDLSASNGAEPDVDGRDLMLAYMANNRIELLVRKYSGKSTHGEDIRFKMLTEKIRQSLEMEKSEKYDALLEISNDIKKVSARSKKRKQFIATLK